MEVFFPVNVSFYAIFSETVQPWACMALTYLTYEKIGLKIFLFWIYLIQGYI